MSLKWYYQKYFNKQGRRDSISRVRLGRGSDVGGKGRGGCCIHESKSRASVTAGAVMQKMLTEYMCDVHVRRTDRRTDGRTDGRMDGRMDGRTDGPTDRVTYRVRD